MSEFATRLCILDLIFSIKVFLSANDEIDVSSFCTSIKECLKNPPSLPETHDDFPASELEHISLPAE
jgi:hypothetical protein